MAHSKTKNFYDLTKNQPANDDFQRDVEAMRRDINTLAGILQNTNAMLAMLAMQLSAAQSQHAEPDDSRTLN